MHRPLEGCVVSAVTEFAVEDHGSPQPSPGRVREGCLQAVELGEPGVTHVGVGESIWAGAGHQRSKRVEVDAYVWGRGAIKESGLPWGHRLALDFTEATRPWSGIWRSFMASGPSSRALVEPTGLPALCPLEPHTGGQALIPCHLSFRWYPTCCSSDWCRSA